jgi:hypothetical protein
MSNSWSKHRSKKTKYTMYYGMEVVVHAHGFGRMLFGGRTYSMSNVHNIRIQSYPPCLEEMREVGGMQKKERDSMKPQNRNDTRQLENNCCCVAKIHARQGSEPGPVRNMAECLPPVSHNVVVFAMSIH